MSWWQEPPAVTHCAGVTVVGVSIPFNPKPQPRASARRALVTSQGWQLACGTISYQLCLSVSPWRCHLEGEKKKQPVSPKIR